MNVNWYLINNQSIGISNLYMYTKKIVRCDSRQYKNSFIFKNYFGDYN